MATTFFPMMLDDSRAAASMRPPVETAIAAQEEAIAAQLQAEEAQRKALALQVEESGLPRPIDCGGAIEGCIGCSSIGE